MAGRLKYGLRYKYPHMLADESKIWERFMMAFPDRFESVDYDFRVGSGAPVPEGTEDNFSRMITMLSQKRIDVIGWVGDSPEIIEVKIRVGLSTLGQVLGYRILFERDFKEFGKPGLMVVCEIISGDDHLVLEENEVEIFVV